MLGRRVHAVLAVLLLFFSILLLVFRFILTGLVSVSLAVFRRRRANRRSIPFELLKLQYAGEFRFERAIQAYEQLIDSTFAEGRR
jgi:hypothetical protein